MTIRIGANPIGWSNDDMLELGGETPLETCLSEAQSIGFVGMELGNKFPRQPDQLKAALAPFNLACVSGWYSAELLKRDAKEEMAALRPHLDLLRAMGSTVLVFAETSNAIHGQMDMPLSKRPVMDKNAWKDYGQRITELSKMTLDEGVKVVYHHHMGTIVQSEADIDALMDNTGDALHLLLDTGHATWGGADPVALAKRYQSRIAHVHAKDVRPDVRAKSDAEDWSFLKSVLEGVYTQPGDGMVDYRAVFAALKAYSGWVVVEAEQDPVKANPLHYHTMGYQNLKRFMVEAGMTLDRRHQ